MSSLMWKTFNLCFSRFQCFPTISFSPQPTSAAAAAAAGDHDQDQKFPPDTTNPTIFKNFNSLYDANCSEVSTSKSGTFSSSTTTTAAAANNAATEDDIFSSSTDSEDDCIPDFTSAFASHRFFFSSPGSSNSIFEPPEPPPPQGSDAVVGGGTAVHTYSPDPYSDFRESMVEMIEARAVKNAKADWEFLNELLLCYLTLNPQHTHKFIIGAFADVVVSLISNPPPIDCCRRSSLQRHSGTSDL